jgi:hypothetical protein
MARRKRNISKPELIHCKAYYFGTTKGNSFWKRLKDGELAERGYGELWLTKDALYFRRYLTLKPIEIPTRNIQDTSAGFSHAGKISGKAVFKVHWNKDGQDFVSGFSSVKNQKEMVLWDRMLKKVLKN